MTNCKTEKFTENQRNNADSVIAEFAENPDLVERTVFGSDKTKYILLFFDGYSDKDAIQRFVLLPLINSTSSTPADSIHAVADIKPASSPIEAVERLCQGCLLLFLENGTVQALELPKPQSDNGKEASPENIVLGSHKRLENSCKSNIAILRACVKSPKLAFSEFKLTEGTLANVALCYIDGVADEGVVETAKRRIAYCTAAGVRSTNEFIELFKEDRLSPFPQYVTSERTDRITEALLRGCVVIIPDGSPWAIIAPVTFTDFLKSPEDSHTPWIYSSLIRILRLISVVITIVAPSLYVAVMSFHPRILPVELMISAASGRAAVPLPAIAEVAIMEIFIELIREASTSMPSNVGSAISIVGGIVIGEAAISAGLVSPLLVVIVAISAITSFTIPVYTMVISLRTIRFFSLILASLFGFFGLIISLIFLAIHLVSLKSMGTEYLLPIAPLRIKRWKRDVFNFPIRWVKNEKTYSKR